MRHEATAEKNVIAGKEERTIGGRILEKKAVGSFFWEGPLKGRKR